MPFPAMASELGGNTPLNEARPAGRSLRWRLSWIFAVTVVLTVTTFGIFAYRAAYDAAIESAQARLRSAVTQIKTIADLGVVNQLNSLRTLSANPALAEALRRPGSPLSEAALQALRAQQGLAGDAVVVELLGNDGTVLFSTATRAPDPEAARMVLAAEAPTIGPFEQCDQWLCFDSGVRVMDGTRPAGGVLVTRRLGRGGANRSIAVRLLGEEAMLLVGNRDGTLWSDQGPVAYPGQIDQPVRYDRAGQTRWSVSAQVPPTPWVYAVEIPETVAIAPARALVAPFTIIGVLIAVAAAIIGLRVSQRIANPIVHLTAAAEAIARGDRDVTLVGTERRDEIGRLARAFDTMARSVRSVRDRLESDIDTRTSELTHAVDRLRRLDEELQRSERLATLGRLSGSVGHELRNPLGVMNTVVFMLEEMPDASPKLKEYASLLREQIRLSNRIISDVLDRAQSGAPIRKSTNVGHLLDEVVTHADVPPDITVERAYGGLPAVQLDGDHLRQIMWNLVGNAVQAMHGEAGTLRIAASVAQARLRIVVTDSGPGVNSDTAEKIFEPMFTTKSEGIGLGLSISRAFARASGGDLYVANPGQAGAQFVLELPASS